MRPPRVLLPFAGFLALLLVGTFAVHHYYSHQLQRAYSLRNLRTKEQWKDHFLTQTNPQVSRSIRPGISDAHWAKGASLFWPVFEMLGTPPEYGNRRGFGIEIGFGVDALHEPSLRHSLFPGFTEHHADFLSHASLWRRYFSRPFNAKQWVAPLSNEGRDSYGLYVPTGGCLDLFEAFGGDVLLFGTSEVYRNLIPEELSRAMPSSSSRVLSCASGGQLPDELMTLLQELARSSSRARWAVWGLSYWNARPAPLQAGRGPLARQHALEKLAPSRGFHWQQLGLASWLPVPGWNDVFPAMATNIRRLQRDPGYDAWLESEQSYWAREGYLLVSSETAASPGRLETSLKELELARIAQNRRWYHCDLAPGLGAKIHETIQAMHRISDNLLIYLPPTLPAFHADESPCFHQALRQFLQSLQGPRVKVVTDSWRDYGLEPSDYMYRTWLADRFYVNTDHTAFGGARKVTARISEVIRRSSSQVASLSGDHDR